jgi:hypothetical protein
MRCLRDVGDWDVRKIAGPGESEAIRKHAIALRYAGWAPLVMLAR